MRVYQKNANRTAQEIADMIKEYENSVTIGKRQIIESISYQAYGWLEMNTNPIAHLVEELLDNKYHVTIGRFKLGGYKIYIDWKKV